MAATRGTAPYLVLVLCIAESSASEVARTRQRVADLTPGVRDLTPAVPRGALVRTLEEPLFSARQGPEGFAYEVSHPVLDEYGQRQGAATQYHAQDGEGRYRYSYSHPGSSREEYVDETGAVQGSYAYRSDTDEELSMSYYADDTGFHVKEARLPDLAALAPRDEPLVAAIRAAHIRLWSQMWARAAAASVGQPLGPSEPLPESYVPLMMGGVAPLESDVISADDGADEPLVADEAPDAEYSVEDASAVVITAEEGPALDDPALQPFGALVPTFPGAPGAWPQAVSDAPRPLETGAGLSSPDSETVVIEARDTSAPRGAPANSDLDLAPLGALRLRAAASGREPALRLKPRQRQPTPELHQLLAPQLRQLVRQQLPQLRVSEAAARAGVVPVAARHNVAQVRPSGAARAPAGESAPVLEDPLVYYYSSLLHEARQAAKPQTIILV